MMQQIQLKILAFFIAAEVDLAILRTKADPYYSEILKARINFLPSEGNTDGGEHLFENTD